MPQYRITRRGAQHRRREGDDRKMKTYGYGDTIELTREQYESGRYNHLGLSHTTRGATTNVDVTKHGGAFKAQDTVDAPRSAPKPAEGDGETDPQNDLDAQREEDADAGGGETDETKSEISDEDRTALKDLKTKAEAINSAQTLQTTRTEIVESGLLGDDSQVPTKKKDILAAIDEKLGDGE